MSIAHTQNQTIELPDVHIHEYNAHHTYVPLRGYAYVLAIFVGARPIGWIDVIEDLGYESVKDWMAKTDWKDQGL